MATTITTKATPAISASTEGGKLTLTFGDGRSIIVDPTLLPQALQFEAMLHGLKQKLMDCAAIPRDTVTGRSATLDDKFAAVEECALRITSADGTWNKVREGGASSSKGGLLVDAMMELTGKSRAEITAFIDGKSKEEVAALRINQRVAVVIARLSAERNAAKSATFNTDDMLDALM